MGHHILFCKHIPSYIYGRRGFTDCDYGVKTSILLKDAMYDIVSLCCVPFTLAI